MVNLRVEDEEIEMEFPEPNNEYKAEAKVTFGK